MSATLPGMATRAGRFTFVAAIGALMIAASGCSSSGISTPGSPDADAAGLFPHSFDHARLLRASAAKTTRQDYTFDLAGMPHRATYLVVNCAEGMISVDIGPGANGESCHGKPTGLATYCGGFPPSVVVEVSNAQDGPWGAAMYTAPPGNDC
jgi:hypothetical protein